MAADIWQLPQVGVGYLNQQRTEQVEMVVAGGRVPNQHWLRHVAPNKNIYCADKGIGCCLRAQLDVKALYGDVDSGAAADYIQAQQLGTEVHRFPPAKDDTDLQLVLQRLPQGHVLASGVWGGRFDHLYSNIFSLLSHKLGHQVQVCLADEREVMLLLAAGDVVELRLWQQPLALSLLPLTPSTVVTMAGVQWPLEQAELTMLHPYAISNLPREQCSCSCSAGAVGLYLVFAE